MVASRLSRKFVGVELVGEYQKMAQKRIDDASSQLGLFQSWSNGTELRGCLLYTSDAADERSSVDLGGRRIIKKKKHDHTYLDSYNKMKERAREMNEANS